ncbi:hypothetical protein Pmani_025819 [Petrolisthes manimaculis]|uniref:Uncharacterized protein n=1 Tax=Petrolisthes manimaculis TaxID=1843537 RepID=A0AAE1U0S3_9EUCA|nr:hypothetical protein Pmani_025819 [Petrolisthes manimaculis]
MELVAQIVVTTTGSELSTLVFVQLAQLYVTSVHVHDGDVQYVSHLHDSSGRSVSHLYDSGVGSVTPALLNIVLCVTRARTTPVRHNLVVVATGLDWCRGWVGSVTRTLTGPNMPLHSARAAATRSQRIGKAACDLLRRLPPAGCLTWPPALTSSHHTLSNSSY